MAKEYTLAESALQAAQKKFEVRKEELDRELKEGKESKKAKSKVESSSMMRRPAL